MGSACEVLVEGDDRDDARRLTTLVADEAHRVEQKYSRYLETGIVHAINTTGEAIEVDDETARL